jgi:hypothetical protein
MRAQVWSMDFAASVVIFSASLMLLLFAWTYTSGQNEQQVDAMMMENALMTASDALVRHPGTPEGWNATTVTSIGLASKDNVLDAGKVQSFLELDNSTIKALLGLGNYEFYFDVRYPNGTIASLPDGDQIIKGDYPSGAMTVIPVERYALYMERVAKMRLIAWT